MICRFKIYPAKTKIAHGLNRGLFLSLQDKS